MLGSRIGNYVVLAELGKGGMGEVFLAEHVRIGRKAAIKLLLPEFAKLSQSSPRFLAEAQAASRIRHPNVVDVIDYDVTADSGRPFIVMEYLEGASLRECLKRRQRFEPELSAVIAGQITQGLIAIHAQGLVHRDLKPENVFAARAGADERSPVTMKILDFGTAKWLEGQLEGQDFRTKTGALIGTPTYMSPEQCRGGRELGPASDIYALGCMLFELLSGRAPFQGNGHGDLIVGHISEPPPALAALVTGVPPELERLVQRMLFKAPADRPSALEVASELGELARERSRALAAFELGLGRADEAALLGGSSRTALSPAHVWSTGGQPSSGAFATSQGAVAAALGTSKVSSASAVAVSTRPKPSSKLKLVSTVALVAFGAFALIGAYWNKWWPSRSVPMPHSASAQLDAGSALSVSAQRSSTLAAPAVSTSPSANASTFAAALVSGRARSGNANARVPGASASAQLSQPTAAPNSTAAGTVWTER